MNHDVNVHDHCHGGINDMSTYKYKNTGNTVMLEQTEVFAPLLCSPQLPGVCPDPTHRVKKGWFTYVALSCSFLWYILTPLFAFLELKKNFCHQPNVQ